MIRQHKLVLSLDLPKRDQIVKSAIHPEARLYTSWCKCRISIPSQISFQNPLPNYTSCGTLSMFQTDETYQRLMEVLMLRGNQD